MLLSYIKYKATLFILLESGPFMQIVLATSIGAYIKTQMVLFEFILAMKFDFGSFLTWLTSWLSCVMYFLVFFVTFPHGVLSRVWYLIALIQDRCLLPYFHCLVKETDITINLILLIICF